jgi:hypothetical protein
MTKLKRSQARSFTLKNRWTGEIRFFVDTSEEGARTQLEKDIDSLWDTEDDWKLVPEEKIKKLQVVERMRELDTRKRISDSVTED